MPKHTPESYRLATVSQHETIIPWLRFQIRVPIVIEPKTVSGPAVIGGTAKVGPQAGYHLLGWGETPAVAKSCAERNMR